MKHWRQRLLSGALALVFAAALLPAPALASGKETYIDYIWDENANKLISETKTCSTYTTITAENPPTEWAAGWYVVSGTVEISQRITVTGNVHLILKDGAHLTASQGIQVTGANSLTVYAQSEDADMGKLTAETVSSGFAAAIGGGGRDSNGNGGNGGNITVNGGKVTAKNSDGAAIGGGTGGTGGTGGNITINGGTVTAEDIGGGGTDGDSGTFTANGNAVIFAYGGDGTHIADQGNKESWSGVIFEGVAYDGGTFTVTPPNVTITKDVAIPLGGALTVGAGSTVTVNSGVTLTNYGTITNRGTIINNGTIVNYGTITNYGSITNNGTITGSAITNNGTVTQRTYSVTVSGGTADKSSAAQGETVTITATVPDGKKFVKWTSEPAVTFEDANSAATTFTMPDKDVVVTANFAPIYIPVPDPVYPPSVSPSEGGSAAVTPLDPKPGDTVTVTPRPEDGYEVDSITVTDPRGGLVEMTPQPDGTYTFTQPSGAVTVTVTFRAAGWDNPFSDVAEGDWYYDAVRYVAERGLMSGTAPHRFSPGAVTSRGMLMTILARMDGVDTAGSDPWYQAGMDWAVAAGVSDGTDPDGPITREQLAVMLYRFAGSPAVPNLALLFDDADQVSPWADYAMRWAVDAGIITGKGGGVLAPGGQATRGEAAAMLMRFCQYIDS